MQKLIEKARERWESLNKGERALAVAADRANDKGLGIPTFGLGLDTVWDHDIPEIVESAKKWNIDTMFYASGQTGSIETLGLFTEAGAAIGSLQKLTLNTMDFNMVDGEIVRYPRTVWAFEIKIL